MSGNEEREEVEPKLGCTECDNTGFKKYFREFGRGWISLEGGDIDYENYDFEWNDEEWQCDECGTPANAATLRWIEENM